jgi:hypothetical protein
MTPNTAAAARVAPAITAEAVPLLRSQAPGAGLYRGGVRTLPPITRLAARQPSSDARTERLAGRPGVVGSAEAPG